MLIHAFSLYYVGDYHEKILITCNFTVFLSEALKFKIVCFYFYILKQLMLAWIVRIIPKEASNYMKEFIPSNYVILLLF